ncbi:hypothetical protein E2P84_43950 [Burkholderia cepacia]|uniref:DUF2946 domain-containing protein n=1 Tax=Burkholderia cepacia TaxID=292 RepID=A0AAX2RS96_BURCE|nr:hypothetical protein [Burkholderia cepacia]TES60903.1 hypothetical protein E2P84_43950 [Burkholderia cepacia]TET01605.1 hypothetical protein E3D36_16345 [Burkholderia cepacia]TEU47618.1 hypothetical protein E3D37_16580 [Burkholderia cepacia]TEU53490.1 hypothetical protein E3D38_12165 [Burkholderia cepacia]TEV02096.1 hypothetical protein E3D40_13095 [Burkholderia cepacia]
MKRWFRFVACFLIAWLPMLGYPAQAVSCPEMSSMPATQHRVKAVDASAMTGCLSTAKQHATRAQSSACHGNMSGAACGMPAIPVSHAIVFAPVTPVYRAIASIFGEQFIPELPAPPPRAL